MPTTKESSRRMIVKGPSVNQLFDALRNAYAPKGICQLARFTINTSERGNREILIKVTSISHEDGSGHSFNFEGYYVKPGSQIEILTQGYYNSNTRKGTITQVF